MFNSIINTVFVFFFNKNVKILNHKKIFLSYNWAFGHQILSLEGISRIYGSNQKIALIEGFHCQETIHI